MQVICNHSKHKQCKKEFCSCFRKHTHKSSCDDGCDDNENQKCISIEKEKVQCQYSGCEKKMVYKPGIKYCKTHSGVVKTEHKNKYNKNYRENKKLERKTWEDVVEKYKERDRLELIAHIQYLEAKLREKNGHKNPVWYKYCYSFNSKTK